MNQESVFTKIINRELPSDIVFENERIIVIKSIDPKAPVHLLGITKEPFTDLHQLLQDQANKNLFWELYRTLSDLAITYKVDKTGYKLTTNIGKDAGQTVFHLHVHMLGGKTLQE